MPNLDETPEGGEGVAEQEWLEKKFLASSEENWELLEKQRVGERSALAIELSESQENFSFPGIDPAVYPKLKAHESESLGMVTSIDELVERFKSEGVKVITAPWGTFVMPAKSEDQDNDILTPKDLNIVEGMDERLKRLILLDRG